MKAIYINPLHPDHDMVELLQTGLSSMFGTIPPSDVVKQLLDHFRHPKAMTILLTWLRATPESDVRYCRLQKEHRTTEGSS